MEASCLPLEQKKTLKDSVSFPGVNPFYIYELASQVNREK